MAWDALSGSGVTPVVPAMSQQADGYFLFPTTSPTAPDPNSSLGGYTLWKNAGLDAFMYVVRGGTHIEWSQVPYTSATTYGAPMNAYYTLAWIDRWVSGNLERRKAGLQGNDQRAAGAPQPALRRRSLLRTPLLGRDAARPRQ